MHNLARLPVLSRLRSHGSDRPPDVVGDAGPVIAKPDTETVGLAVILGKPDFRPNESPVSPIDGLATRMSRRGRGSRRNCRDRDGYEFDIHKRFDCMERCPTSAAT
jgi:hypothetical protein